MDNIRLCPDAKRRGVLSCVRPDGKKKVIEKVCCVQPGGSAHLSARTVNAVFVSVLAVSLVLLDVSLAFVATGCGKDKQNFCLSCCDQATFRGSNAVDKLKSWNIQSASFIQLTNSVRIVTALQDDVKPIAVFDFDGTLYSERSPTFFDWYLAGKHISEVAPEKFTKEEIEVARRVVKDGVIPGWDDKYHDLLSRAWKGVSLDSYTIEAWKALDSDTALVGGRKLFYKDLLFQPMVEVIDYLKEMGFRVFICTGTDRHLVREVLNAIKFPHEDVVGSSFEYVVRDFGYIPPYTEITGRIAFKNLHEKKIISIMEEIGRKPDLVFGNSSGDYEMASIVAHGEFGTENVFMVMCDDTVRDNGNIDEAEKIRKACEERHWIPISMKNDWKVIYK